MINNLSFTDKKIMISSSEESHKNESEEENKIDYKSNYYM
jgi:hypothetical protein